MSFVCQLYVLVCHSYVLVCHLYVTPMYLYVIRISLVCGFTMDHSSMGVFYISKIVKMIPNHANYLTYFKHERPFREEIMINK